jgi:hypothetical protein
VAFGSEMNDAMRKIFIEHESYRFLPFMGTAFSWQRLICLGRELLNLE